MRALLNLMLKWMNEVDVIELLGLFSDELEQVTHRTTASYCPKNSSVFLSLLDAKNQETPIDQCS